MTMADERPPSDPRPQTAEEWLAKACPCERQGELFRAYQLARQALAKFPDDLALQHRAVLCLTSTGATGVWPSAFSSAAIHSAQSRSLLV
jgi:hypothetical protein